jgi:hypothetical protein
VQVLGLGRVMAVAVDDHEVRRDDCEGRCGSDTILSAKPEAWGVKWPIVSMV